jgi:hypothetical protein
VSRPFGASGAGPPSAAGGAGPGAGALALWREAAFRSGLAPGDAASSDLPAVPLADLVSALDGEGLAPWGARLAAGHGALPVSDREEARRWLAAHRATCLWAETAFEALLAALNRAGVASLVLKGPALAARLYGDPSARTYRDLDLLVEPARRRTAARVLGEQGYALTWDPPRARVSVLRVAPVTYASGSRGSVVDLHWGLSTPELAWDDAPTPRHVATQRVRVGRVEVATLADEPLLLYLAVHGGKHGFRRLAWLVDFARLLRVGPGIDAVAVGRMAARAGFSRLLHAAVLLADQVAGIPAPAPLLAPARGDRGARRLAEAFRRRDPPRPLDLRVPLSRRERLRDGMRDVVGTVVAALEPRWQEPSKWPGWVRRPARAGGLVWKYVRRPWGATGSCGGDRGRDPRRPGRGGAPVTRRPSRSGRHEGTVTKGGGSQQARHRAEAAPGRVPRGRCG